MSNLKQLINTFKETKSLDEKKEILHQISQSPSNDSLIFLFHVMEDADIGLKTITHKYMQSVRVKLIEQGEDVDTNLKVEFVKKFLGRYRSAKNKNDKLAALKKLSKIKTPIIFKQLTGIINTEKDYYILGVILKLIAYNGESRAIPILKVFLNQSNVALRISAIEAFSYIHSADLSEILSQLIVDPEPKIALKVCELLWNHQPILIRNKVLEVIKSGKKNDKLLLIEILKNVSTFDAKNFMLMLIEDPDVGMKAKQYSDTMAIKYDSSQADLAIDELSDEKESSIYEEIENETNLEIQIKKLSTLYNLKNEKTLKFCCDLIEKTTSKFLISSLVKNIPQIAKTIGNTKNIKELITPFLNHQDERVRGNAIEGLSEIADVDIIQNILKIVETDMSNRVISAAANFLLEIAHDKVINRLVKMAKDGNFPQKNSVLFVIDSKIDKIKKNDIEKILGILCTDQNLEIVKKAKGLLYKAKTSGGQKKTSSQEIEFNTEDSMAERINKILELEEIPVDVIENQFSILEDKNSAKNDKLRSIRALSALIISEKQKNRFSKQLDRFKDDSVLLSALIPAIGRVSGKSIAPKLKNYLNHPDSRIRANTIEILGEILEGEIEIDTIITPLLSDKDYRVIANAIKILYGADKNKAIEKISIMLKNPDKKSRNSGIFAIREIKDPALIDMLKLHINDPDMEVAIHAGYAMIELEKSISNPKISIENLSTEEQLVKLIDIFQYGNVYSRKTSIEKISALMTNNNVEIIGSVLDKTDHNYIQSLLVKLIGLTRSEKAIPIIKPFLTNENERVRANAVEGLTMIESQKVPFILGNLIMKEKDSRTLSNIIIGISTFSPDDAEDYLGIVEKQKRLDDEHIIFLKKVISDARIPPEEVQVQTDELPTKELKKAESQETKSSPEPAIPESNITVEPEIDITEKTNVVEKKSPDKKKSQVEEKKTPKKSFKDKYAGIRKKPKACPPQQDKPKPVTIVKSDGKKLQLKIAVAVITLIFVFAIFLLNSSSNVQKIEQHIKNGNYIEAKRLLDLQDDKDTNADLIYLGIYIELEKGNYDIAESFVTKGLSLEPDSDRFLKIKIVVDDAKSNSSGNVKINIAKLNDPNSVDPDSKQKPSEQNVVTVFHSMMKQWCKNYYVPDRKTIKKTRLTSKIKKIIKMANDHIKNNNIADAKKSFNKIITSKTRSIIAWKEIAQFFYDRNNFKKSMTGFLYSYRLNQKNSKSRKKFLKSDDMSKITSLLFRKKYYCDALICNLMQFATKPDAIVALKISSLLECDKDSKSLSEKNNPDFKEFKSFGSKNEIKKWKNSANELSINNKQVIVFFDFLSKNNHKEKIEEYIKYFKKKFNDVDFLEYIVGFYLKSGKYAKTIKSGSLALKKYPKSVILLYRIGDAYSKLKKYKLSNSFLEKAIAIDPDYTDSLEILLQNYDKLNDTSKLKKYCTQLVNSGSKTVYPYIKLAELNARSKNYENAFINYYKAMSLAKNDPEKKKVKKHLDDLKNKMKTPGTKDVSPTKIIKDVKINSIDDLKKNTDDLINLYEEE